MFSSNAPGRRAAEPNSTPAGAASSAKHTHVAGHRWARLPASAAASLSWVQKGSLALAVTGMVSGAVLSQMHTEASDDWAKAAGVSDAPTAAETAVVDFTGAQLSSNAGNGATESGAKHRATAPADSGTTEALSGGFADPGNQDLQSPQRDAKSPSAKHRADTPGTAAATEQKRGGDAAESAVVATAQETTAEPTDPATADAAAAARAATASTDEATSAPADPKGSTTPSIMESPSTVSPTPSATGEPTDESLLDIGIKLPLPSLEVP